MEEMKFYVGRGGWKNLTWGRIFYRVEFSVDGNLSEAEIFIGWSFL